MAKRRNIYDALNEEIARLEVDRPLKRCPFCKGTGKRWIDDDGDYTPHIVLGCPACWWVTSDENEWNTRPIEDELEAQIAALKNEIGCHNEKINQ